MAEQREPIQHKAPARPAPSRVNSIDTAQLRQTIDDIRADPSKASCSFAATTTWKHGTVSNCHVSHYRLAGEDIPQDYDIAIDEPAALLGTDTAPNPQMMLFAALNACVLNTFVVNAAVRGITIDELAIDLEGELDLRGFLGIDPDVNPGYDELSIVCRVRADASRDELERCLEASTRHSPNFQTVSRPVEVKYRLEVV